MQLKKDTRSEMKTEARHERAGRAVAVAAVVWAAGK